MKSKLHSVVTTLAEVAVTSIHIPGATADGIRAQLLNIDAQRGIIATVIYIEAGVTIPAHFHERGAEAHFVLEGDLVDGGQTFGPGTYLTHAAGTIHGPHSSVHGCKVLTIQDAPISEGDLDFQFAAQQKRNEDGLLTVRRAIPGSGSDRLNALPETQQTGPTDDNPTNPTTT